MQSNSRSPASNTSRRPRYDRVLLVGAGLMLASLSALCFGQQSRSTIDGSQDRLDNHRAHVIKADAGDSLQSISRAYFGTGGLWRLLAEFNDLPAAATLHAQQMILVPTLEKVERQFATVLYVHGAAQVRNPETTASVSVVRDMQINVKDIIETGTDGFVSLLFQNGSVINLQPTSTLRLLHLDCVEDHQSCFIDLGAGSGELDVDVNSKPGQDTQFRIRTPFADAAVRGTVFDFESSQQRLLVGVSDGQVQIGASGSQSLLEQGFGSVTAAGQPPGTPEALLIGPTFTSIPPRVAVTDSIGWWQITGARDYLWAISNDPAGNSPVTNGVTTRTHMVLDDIPAGEYFLGVRGRADSGLKGLRNTEKITIARIDPALPQITLNSTRIGQQILIAVEQPDASIAGYEIQLANSEDFVDVISVDVGESGQASFSNVRSPLYARVRALIEPTVVSAFGPGLRVN